MQAIKRVVFRHRKVRPLVWTTVAVLIVGSILQLAYFHSFSRSWTSPEISLGATTLNIEVSENEVAANWFDHSKWTGAPEEFSVTHEFSLRLPRGVLKTRFNHAPVASVRRNLPDSVPELEQLLRSKSSVKIFCAAEALAGKGADAMPALPVLLEAAEQEPLSVPFIMELAHAAPAEAAKTFASTLETTSPALRLYLAELLTSLGTNGLPAVPALRRLFAEATGKMRPVIAQSLWRITADCTYTLPHLQSDLETASAPELQGHIIQVLSEFGSHSRPAIPLVLACLRTNTHPHAVQPAIYFLQKCQAEPSVIIPLLKSILERTHTPAQLDYETRFVAIRSLGSTDSSALPVLIEIYRGTNQSETIYASEALVRLIRENQGPADVFLPDLYSSDTQRLFLACAAAADLGAKAEPLLPRLVDIAQAHTRAVRVRAAHALLKLNALPPHLVPSVLDCLRGGYPGNNLASQILDSLSRTNLAVKTLIRTRLAEDRSLAASYKLAAAQHPAR